MKEIKTFEERKKELLKKGKEKGVITYEELAESLKGLELDALTPERTREIFAEELQAYIDNGAYIEEVKSNYLYRKIRDEVDKYINTIVNDVYSDLIDKVDVQEPDMMKLVREGKTYIPTENICNVNADIKEIVGKYFEQKVRKQKNEK